jgi:repressor LexA
VLTELETRILDFIRDYLDAHGYAPIIREIGEGVDISSRGTVHRYVHSLFIEFALWLWLSGRG